MAAIRTGETPIFGGIAAAWKRARTAATERHVAHQAAAEANGRPGAATNGGEQVFKDQTWVSKNQPHNR